MTNRKFWNKKTGIAAAAVILVALLAVLYIVFGPKTTQGMKHVVISVVDQNGASTFYQTDTDAEYLRQALEETEGLTIGGKESEYGLMIETVNGITADYDKDGAYWAIFVNREYASYGVDEQPVTDGDTYKLEYTTN